MVAAVVGFAVGVTFLVGDGASGVEDGTGVSVGGGEVKITRTFPPSGIGEISVFLRRKKNPTAMIIRTIMMIIGIMGGFLSSFI